MAKKIEFLLTPIDCINALKILHFIMKSNLFKTDLSFLVNTIKKQIDPISDFYDHIIVRFTLIEAILLLDIVRSFYKKTPEKNYQIKHLAKSMDIQLYYQSTPELRQEAVDKFDMENLLKEAGI
jgi:hypothetical protein